MANNTMRKGILCDFIGIHTAGMGQLAIEDTETHKVELVIYELKSTFKGLHRFQGKEVYWECDEFGILARLEPVKGS